MKNIDLLPTTNEIKSAILEADEHARRFVKVGCDILEVKDNAVTVRIEQFLNTGKVYTQKELMEIGKGIFARLDIKIHWRALTWKGNGIEAVSPEWIRNQMKKHNTNSKEVSEGMGINLAHLEKILSNQKELIERQKAEFFYYFKNL